MISLPCLSYLPGAVKPAPYGMCGTTASFAAPQKLSPSYRSLTVPLRIKNLTEGSRVLPSFILGGIFMEPIYKKTFEITDLVSDRFGKLKPSAVCYFVQEVAGQHFSHMALTADLEHQNLFWAIIRHRVQITRLPRRGENITVETWPMPTTRVAYPRSVVAYDEKGQELFRSISLWVLMDKTSRAMVLPGKSGIAVRGILRGGELPRPNSLTPIVLSSEANRRVCFTDLDVNGHMNNCRYLDWAADLLPSAFHENHTLTDVTMCYLAETREGDALALSWEMGQEGTLRLDIHRCVEDKKERVFCADFHYAT